MLCFVMVAFFIVVWPVSILDLLPRVEVNCLMFEGTHQRQLAVLSCWGDKRLSNRGWLPSLAFTTLWRFTAFLWVVNSEFGGCFDKLCWGLLKNRSYQALEGNVLAHCYDPDIWWEGFGGWQIRFLLLNGIWLGSSPTYCLYSPTNNKAISP